MPAGRPSTYSKKIADEVCEKISNGMSLREICRAEGMPDRSTIFDWLYKYKEFAHQYAQARDEQADIYADEIIAISDEEPRLVANKHGEMVVDSGWVTWQNNRAHNRKWVASKLKPKKYGERLQHANDENNPMPQMVLYCPKEEKTDD